MSKMEQVADEEMVKNAVGGKDEYDELAEPPNCEADTEHPMYLAVKNAIKEVYDPEIPVNIYELGLIYKIDFMEEKDGLVDVYIQMTLTSPGCPVAQEMPEWIKGAVRGVEGVGQVDVEIVWDPTWDPSMMAETARMQLNMFS